MDGFLLINKPAGITSFDCVMLLKKQLRLATKIGHTGTLDAFASGLLIIALGRSATAQIKDLMVLDKVYEAHAYLGAQTDTLDPTGTIVLRSDMVPTQEQIILAFQTLQPHYWQIPPLFSALKHKGERLSDLTRQARDQEFLNTLARNKKNLVDIYSATVTAFDAPCMNVRLHVSHGTYIRSVIRDVARLASSCAYVTKLSRTTIGPFTLDDACAVQSITAENYQTYLRSPEQITAIVRDYLHTVNQKKLKARLDKRSLK